MFEPVNSIRFILCISSYRSGNLATSGTTSALVSELVRYQFESPFLVRNYLCKVTFNSRIFGIYEVFDHRIMFCEFDKLTFGKVSETLSSNLL